MAAPGRRNIPKFRWGEQEADRPCTAREYFGGGRCRSAETVYQNTGSDVGYEKADREVTARFTGYGLALAAPWALSRLEQNGRDVW